MNNKILINEIINGPHLIEKTFIVTIAITVFYVNWSLSSTLCVISNAQKQYATILLLTFGKKSLALQCSH